MATLPPSAAGGHPLRCLIVRPVKMSDHGGDEVVYRKSIDYLSRHFAIDTVEVHPIGGARKFLNLVKLAPPEILRWISAENVERVRAAIAGNSYDAVFFFNEITFPSSEPALVWTGPTILAAHNVHSVVARSENSLLSRVMRPITAHFERRWYGDRRAELVCISNNDVAGLRASGVDRDPVFVAPPGAPPADPFPDPFRVAETIVLTGSYGWWRKRRDLQAFLASGGTVLPIYTADPEARALIAEAKFPLIEDKPDFAAAMHFGLVTDRFEGGFKLKSLEYVARNCTVLSFCDLSPEFVGLPHADEFVRRIASADEARGIIAAMRAEDPVALGERFRAFRDACLARYEWSACLAPLYDAFVFARDGEVAK